MTGTELISKERLEQIEKHGWIDSIDEKYTHNELVDAALYLLTGKEEYYPANWSLYKFRKFEAKLSVNDKTESLKVAGSLIAAEIDRLNNEKPF